MSDFARLKLSAAMKEFNFFDVVTILVAVWAIIAGWRRGVILQLCSLIGIILSLLLASSCGETVGRMLKFGEGWATPAGFLVVAVVTLLVVLLAGWLLRKIIKSAGLGAMDILLGIFLSLLKWLLLLSAIYLAIGAANRYLGIIDEQTLSKSYTYRPVASVSEYILPFITDTFSDGGVEEWLPEIGREANQMLEEKL